MALNAGTSPANYAAVPISEGGASRGATPRASDTASEEEFSKETFASLKKYVLEGDINLKTTGLVAGAGIMVCGFVSCMAHIFDLDIPNAMLDVLMFCIGYVCR